MNKLYSVLATLMFLCFVTTSGAWMLNKTIDKAVISANEKLDDLTDDFNKSLKDAKLVHNLYFANCFPNACAKASFASYAEKYTEIDPATNQEISKVKKFDLGTTSYIIAKYNPITGKAFIDSNANNVILNENGEKLATVFFSKFKYELSSDMVSYYVTLLNKASNADDVMKYIEGETNLEIDNLKVSLKDDRLKADRIVVDASSFNATDKTVSSTANIVLKGATVANDPIKVDSSVNLTFENIAKDLVEQSVESSKTYFEGLAVDKNLDPRAKAMKQSLKVIEYIEQLLTSVQEFNVNKSVVKLNNFDLKVYDTASSEDKVLSDVNVKADIALDEKLNPAGSFAMKVFATDIKDLEELEKLQVRLPNDPNASAKMFIKEDDNTYTSNLHAKEGKLHVNQKDELTIDGLVKKGLKMATGLVQMAKMGIAFQQQQ